MKEQKTAKLTLPRGIRLLPPNPLCVGRPYGVQWRLDGRRKTKSFATLEARETFARGLVADVRAHGTAAFRLDPDEARVWRAFRAELGAGVELEQVLRCWNRHGRAEASQLTVGQAIDRFLAAKEAEGLNRLTIGHYRPVMRRLAAVLGPLNAAAVTREDIARWMDGLDCAPVTRGREFAYCRGLFAWLKVGRLVPENPCDGIKRPKFIRKKVSVMPVADARALFSKNIEHPELCARLALEAFAGIRFETVCKIQAADIRFADRGIELPAESMKTEQREYVQGYTPNLWRWLKWCNPSTWTMTPRQYLEAKSKAFVRADIPHPRNVLRHSYATYDFAAWGDLSGTCGRLCHSSPTMFRRHYKGMGTKRDGKAYLKIVPPAP